MGSYFAQDFENILNINQNLTIVYSKQMAPNVDSMKDTLQQIKNRSRSFNI